MIVLTTEMGLMWMQDEIESLACHKRCETCRERLDEEKLEEGGKEEAARKGRIQNLGHDASTRCDRGCLNIKIS